MGDIFSIIFEWVTPRTHEPSQHVTLGQLKVNTQDYNYVQFYCSVHAVFLKEVTNSPWNGASVWHSFKTTQVKVSTEYTLFSNLRIALEIDLYCETTLFCSAHFHVDNGQWKLAASPETSIAGPIRHQRCSMGFEIRTLCTPVQPVNVIVCISLHSSRRNMGPTSIVQEQLVPPTRIVDDLAQRSSAQSTLGLASLTHTMVHSYLLAVATDIETFVVACNQFEETTLVKLGALLCKELSHSLLYLIIVLEVTSRKCGFQCREQNTVAITFPAEDVTLNVFFTGEVGCFHVIEAALVSGVKWSTHVSTPVTTLNRNSFPSRAYRIV
ncbi:hypothetical protein ANN_17758 [Periplaneta americana]|uniref:Uncharacterized protein n=1 Tax=Periplaneta americana TaxID=6978 RepID=A0ABQ8SUT3_PERAM|nr:hypothetical protein ANN_17758 [Periplaneta americana]